MKTTFNFDENVKETMQFQCNSLNLYDFKKNIGVVIEKIDKDNYKDVILYILKNNFKMYETDKVSFAIFGKIVKFDNLSFDNLSEMRNGYIFRIMISEE
jgi:hypothetical protein